MPDGRPWRGGVGGLWQPWDTATRVCWWNICKVNNFHQSAETAGEVVTEKEDHRPEGRLSCEDKASRQD